MDYFAKPEIGAEGGISSKQFRKNLQEQFANNDGTWMAADEIIEKMK